MRLSEQTVRASLGRVRPLFASERVSMRAKRRLVDAVSGATRPPRGTGSVRTTIAGMPLEVVRPPLASYDGALLFLHGGAYAMGTAPGYRGFVSRLAGALGSEALVPDYPLAPENRYPDALDGITDLYLALVSSGRIDPDRTVLAGDSAGGGLTLALAQRLRDDQQPLPAALGLICPWLDLKVDIDRQRPARTDPLIVPDMITTWASRYVGDADPGDPGISPLRGELNGLPPIVLDSAGDDPLASDAEQLEALLGTDRLDHVQHPDLWHDFHLQVGLMPAADRAVADLTRRLGAARDAHLSAASTR